MNIKSDFFQALNPEDFFRRNVKKVERFYDAREISHLTTSSIMPPKIDAMAK